MAAIADEAVGGAEQVTVGVYAERGEQIFKIAVVAEIKGGTGMRHVGDKEVGVEIFVVGQVGKVAVRKNRVVLEDHTKGEGAGHLVIPVGAEDVIVEYRSRTETVAQPKPQIAIIDLH